MNKLENFTKSFTKTDLPEIQTGDTVKVFQKAKEGEKRKVQTFEGQVLAKKHGNGISGTILVRKVSLGVGINRIFPLHSPNIEKIEVVRKGKTRRSKLYYLKEAKGKKAKLKELAAKPQKTEEHKEEK